MKRTGLIFYSVLIFFLRASGDSPYDLPVNDWLVFLEGGVGIGSMDRTVDGMETEWFGVDTLRAGGENDGVGFRLGIGKRVAENLTPVIYAGGSTLFSGLFFDNHGPFIPPELFYVIKEKAIGLELRYINIRIGGGYSFYSGDVTLCPDDREGAEPGEDWDGILGNTGGPHFIFGAFSQIEGFGWGGDLIFRPIPIQFPETPTGVTPEEFTRDVIEFRISAQIALYLF